MPRLPLGLPCLLLCMLVGVMPASSPAAPPVSSAARQPLPEGALLGLQEEAAQLAAEVAAQDEQGTDARAGERPQNSIDDDGSPDEPGIAAPAALPRLAMEPLPGVTGPAVPPPAAVAREVLVPLRLDLPFMQRVLVEQVFTDNGRARFDMDGAGCNTLELYDPLSSYAAASSSEPAGLRVRMRARARFGLPLFGRCTGLSDWSGQVELLQTPHVLPGGAGFGLGVADSRVFDADGAPSAAGVLWEWIKGPVQPRFGAVRVDLRAALAELRAVLPLVLLHQTADGLLAVLESVRVVDALAAETGVTVSVRLSAPAAFAAPPAAPLSAQETARFRRALADLDGFFTFVARTVAGPSLDVATREALLATLIDGRYRLLDALDEAFGDDEAVRGLFVELWSGLTPLLARLPGELAGEQGLRYLAFIASGDALAALQALGPGTGLDISADGLRRLARVIAPAGEGDPLQGSDAVDEDMRRRFGFGAPLPAPVRRAAPEPQAWMWPLQLLLPAARADTAVELGVRLADWAPRLADLDEYLPLVRDLLDVVAASEQQAGKVPAELRGLFRTLLLATAWQESCWRQFVHENGRVTTLASSAGALGLMQVSKHVWRGFYDVEGLAGDIAYNARAGAEIARHYLLDYALRADEQQHEGGMENLARATYSAYNGGPRQLARYRKSDSPARLRAIDEAFHAKYRAIGGGDDLAVASCYRDG